MRIKLLQEKWSNIQTDIDREKRDRRGLLEERINLLDERIKKAQPMELTKMQNIKE